MQPILLLVNLLVAFAAPPSGRPPVGPLERYEPRVYDVTFDVTITTVEHRIATERLAFDIQDSPVVMPMILQGTYSRVDPSSITPRLWLEAREDTGMASRSRLQEGLPFNTHLVVMPIPEFNGFAIRWLVGWKVQVWSSRIDEKAAAEVTWPREWPAEVQDGLKPQMYIESDDPIFAETVQRISGGELRMVPPYLAAKDIVRYCVNEVRVSGDGLARAGFGVLRGLEVNGAAATARRGLGTPNDLVCVCVAMLRAARIPARPVFGMGEDEKGKHRFYVWAEFFLPDVGWVPFDPVVMRGKGIRTRDVRLPWSEFGTMDDLNRRIPLSYSFLPPVAVTSHQFPAAWGWDPQPGPAPSAEQLIRLQMISRGRGVEDPE